MLLTAGEGSIETVGGVSLFTGSFTETDAQEWPSEVQLSLDDDEEEFSGFEDDDNNDDDEE